MKTLQLEFAHAKALYPKAPDAIKAVFEATFGKEKFSGNIIDRCKTVEDACIELGIDYSTLFDKAEDDYERSEIAIKTFAKALRQDKDASECYYYPYFRRSGVGFSYFGYANVLGYTSVGARLRVDSSEKAIHMGKCLEPEYTIYLNGK